MAVPENNVAPAPPLVAVAQRDVQRRVRTGRGGGIHAAKRVDGLIFREGAAVGSRRTRIGPGRVSDLAPLIFFGTYRGSRIYGDGDLGVRIDVLSRLGVRVHNLPIVGIQDGFPAPQRVLLVGAI